MYHFSPSVWSRKNGPGTHPYQVKSPSQSVPGSSPFPASRLSLYSGLLPCQRQWPSVQHAPSLLYLMTLQEVTESFHTTPRGVPTSQASGWTRWPWGIKHCKGLDPGRFSPLFLQGKAVPLELAVPLSVLSDLTHWPFPWVALACLSLAPKQVATQLRQPVKQ